MTQQVNIHQLTKNNEPGTRQRLLRIAEEMEKGFRFAEMFDETRIVTIYGSALTKSTEQCYKAAYTLARLLVKDNNSIGVVTGGGPGIMEAANRGAFDAGGISLGLGIQLEHISEKPNAYTTDRLDFYYFFARKVILAHIAQGYVFFPGGFGTLDEFFELATLIATKKIETPPTTILMGKTYWENLFHWIRECPVEKYHTIEGSLLDFFTITDDAEEAYHLLDKIPLRIGRSDVV
jgi:uncharacterized protein (TIGR00730 family)